MTSPTTSSTTSSTTSPCIHGFDPGQCAACRTCPHGLAVSRCGQCLAASARASRRGAAPAPTATPTSEQHEGWEISYVPAVSGWQIRHPEAEALPDSYRSLFLARKAVENAIANPSAATSSKRRK